MDHSDLAGACGLRVRVPHDNGHARGPRGVRDPPRRRPHVLLGAAHLREREPLPDAQFRRGALDDHHHVHHCAHGTRDFNEADTPYEQKYSHHNENFCHSKKLLGKFPFALENCEEICTSYPSMISYDICKITSFYR